MLFRFDERNSFYLDEENSVHTLTRIPETGSAVFNAGHLLLTSDAMIIKLASANPEMKYQWYCVDVIFCILF